ncbi:MAG: transposase [Flavobacteriales bacterium]|nr:transposase [Flavobacteriales bacterium]
MIAGGERPLAPQRQGSLGPARGYIHSFVAIRKSKFTEHQIVSILKQPEDGVKVADLCREHGVYNATFYQLKAKYCKLS